MAFFTRVWQKVKELPHLFSIKILLENEETFQMRYNISPNSQWFQKYKPSKLKEQKVNPFNDYEFCPGLANVTSTALVTYL